MATRCRQHRITPRSTSTSTPDFGPIPLRAKAPLGVQTKLALHAAGDVYEREADHVADQITFGAPRTERDETGRVGSAEAAPLTRVQAAHVEHAAAPPQVHAVLRATGEPLAAPIRSRFEPRFGFDFSKVRVHTDAAAAQSARDINARAYTVGHHLVFDAAQFAPHTPAGHRLLAHELTHVVQQNGYATVVQRTPGPNPKDKQNVAVARQRAQALVDRMKKEGALSPAARTTMIEDLKFFEGAAWQAYNDAIRPTLAEVTSNANAGSKKTPYWLRDVSPGLAELADEVTDTFVPGADLNDARFVLGVVRDAVKASLTPQAIRTDKARAAFRARHSGHSPAVLRNIDAALKRVTRDNPELLIAYYEYYAHHELTDELPRDKSVDKDAGATSNGDTDINPNVLKEVSSFATDDPESLLGGTLIHEYSHTPQDNPNNPVFEAKAYGIEYFFAERNGDTRRVLAIENVNSDDSADIRRLRYRAYYTMRELYRRIERGGPDAEEARAMSVEFISKNPSDYRKALREIYDATKNSYVP